MPAQVLHTGGPRYFYKMVALGALYASACTKWWPLGLSKALPVQNGGPWGCVTRLVGGSCWDGLCSFAAARPVQDLPVYLVWPLGRIFQVFGLQAEVPKRKKSSLYKMVAPGALWGSACTKSWQLGVCDKAGRWLLPLLLPGKCKIFLSTLSSHLVAPSKRLVRLGGFPWLLQAEVPQKKIKGCDKSHLPATHTQGPPFCTGTASESPTGPPFCNRTKHLEDATKWPYKVDRKIMVWEQQSYTSHPKAGSSKSHPPALGRLV